jgi:1,4-alpha-glucan branching enzyme
VDSRAGILRLYRDLIQLRRNFFNTTRGLSGDGMHLHHLNNTDKLLAYHRWDRGGPRDDVVVVANFSARVYDAYRVGLPRSGRWRVRFNSDSIGYDFGFGNVPGYDTETDWIPWDNMPVSATIGIGQYAVLILSQDD